MSNDVEVGGSVGQRASWNASLGVRRYIHQSDHYHDEVYEVFEDFVEDGYLDGD